MSPNEFTRLGERHLPELRALALRLTKNATAAEDLLQEAAFWAFKNRDQFRSGTNFRAWALTIVKNTFLTGYRRERRRRDLVQDVRPDGPWRADRTIANPAEGNLGASTILSCVADLPVHLRHPFMLHYEGVKYREISDRLGIPVGTAKSRVFTARQTLRRRLEYLYGYERLAG